MKVPVGSSDRELPEGLGKKKGVASLPRIWSLLLDDVDSEGLQSREPLSERDDVGYDLSFVPPVDGESSEVNKVWVGVRPIEEACGSERVPSDGDRSNGREEGGMVSKGGLKGAGNVLVRENICFYLGVEGGKYDGRVEERSGDVLWGGRSEERKGRW